MAPFVREGEPVLILRMIENGVSRNCPDLCPVHPRYNQGWPLLMMRRFFASRNGITPRRCYLANEC